MLKFVDFVSCSSLLEYESSGAGVADLSSLGSLSRVPIMSSSCRLCCLYECRSPASSECDLLGV